VSGGGSSRRKSPQRLRSRRNLSMAMARLTIPAPGTRPPPFTLRGYRSSGRCPVSTLFLSNATNTACETWEWDGEGWTHVEDTGASSWSPARRLLSATPGHRSRLRSQSSPRGGRGADEGEGVERIPVPGEVVFGHGAIIPSRVGTPPTPAQESRRLRRGAGAGTRSASGTRAGDVGTAAVFRRRGRLAASRPS
jgi:hypothetical protein